MARLDRPVSLANLGGTITEAQHGAKAGPASAHDFDDLDGTVSAAQHGTAAAGGAHVSATGQILDAATVIAAGATLTITAAIGFAAKAGIAILRNESIAVDAEATGALVMLGTAANTDAASFYKSSDLDFGARLRGKDAQLSPYGEIVSTVGNAIALMDAYISGTDAVFVFRNNAGAGNGIQVRGRWKCW